MLSIFDSPLEQSGFELWGPTRRSLWGMGTFTAPRRGGLKPARSYRGTEGSNPSPSSGESGANSRGRVEFGVEIGEYRGVVRVLRRVFQRLLPERPTPERCIEAYFLQRTRFESIAERKLRRRQLTEDGNVEITGRDLRENAGSRRGLLAR
jgi:hypothetical protein